MIEEPIQRETTILRPRARIIKTIGDELISSDIVAIIELVKNSYDANANYIEIVFQGRVVSVGEGKSAKKMLIKEGGSIIIKDDGTGMDIETVKGAWMEPATINKKNTKRSVGGKRRYTGEKGIGRFASAKLATTLEMVTRTEGANEVQVNFNWLDFADDNKYLDQVTCSWEIRNPKEIEINGTVLKLGELNSDWDEDKIKELRVALARLVNPVAPVLDFVMEIQLPGDLAYLSGLVEPPETFNRPDYVIKGNFDAAGGAAMTYYSRKSGFEEQLAFEKVVLRNPVRSSVVGKFSFEFRVWDRASESLKHLALELKSTLKNIKADLDNLAGISIYRDMFRVLPYGEKQNDWLRLDIRRVNNPTLRLSNNQVVGYVSVSLDDNPDLKDQSNREGIVESQAFTDFKELISVALNELETRRYKERPRESDDPESRVGLFNDFSITPVALLVRSRLPGDKEAIELVAKTEASIQRGIGKVQEVLTRYRRLSTLGLLIDVLLHDGNNFLANLDSENQLLLKEAQKKTPDILKLRDHALAINEGRKVLGQMFKRLEPFGGRKRGRPKDIVIEHAIASVFAIYEHQLRELRISSILPVTQNVVRIDDGELQMIFVNLIQNAIYWLETVEDERKILVIIEKSEGELSIIFSDSGPGISDDNRESIFEPYFSTKPDGIGLGLTVVGELVTEYDGDFSLVHNGPLDGATFKITFRRRI